MKQPLTQSHQGFTNLKIQYIWATAHEVYSLVTKN